MKILLVGGGSGGSVSPLLAVAEEILKKHPKAKFLFVGGKKGPEREMAQAHNITFEAITGGKFRRYFSLENFLSPFLIFFGLYQAINILRDFKPDCVFGAGSFIQVPVVWAAKFLGIPVILHQQDVVISLANKLCQPAASKITVTFEQSLKAFQSNFGLFYNKMKDKVVLTGNPFREELLKFERKDGNEYFGLKKDFPTLLVLGGGTGAESLNKLLLEALPKLKNFIQIIHISGKGKTLAEKSEHYHPFEFTSHMGEAYAAADIVISRAGLSTITELSNLKKISIIVPMPNSHQEYNAWLLGQLKAAIIIPQKHLTAEILTKVLKDILFKYELQKGLMERMEKIMPRKANQKISDIIINEINAHKK